MYALCFVWYSLLQEATMGTEEKGGAKEKVEAMQKKFDVRACTALIFVCHVHE